MRRADAALLLLLGACGYSAGFDLAERGIRTVSIEVVGNASFRQRMEIPLTTRLQELLPVHTGLSLAAPARADAVLAVQIEEVRGQSLVQGTTDPVREGALVFRVRAALRDRRSGALIVEREIGDVAEFRTPIGETQTSAAEEAARDLARKIALALEPTF